MSYSPSHGKNYPSKGSALEISGKKVGPKKGGGDIKGTSPGERKKVLPFPEVG